ncbi:hypothetical protein [Treponema zioleckii]|uniref:hypothetical protein n=1 Tax=Treponema zioleckii TaxID=331680 RepID=UPI00168BA092|nr:hypothetical protein [Treponema zioleckii]
MKKIILTVGAMLAMAFTCFAATPEKYFKYDLAGKAILNTTGLKGDYICITDVYDDKLAEDGITEIEFPKEIEGLKVIAICGKVDDFGNVYDLSIGGSIKAVIIPETYEIVNCNLDESTTTQFTGTTTRPLYFGVRPYSDPKYTDVKGHAVINGGLPQAGRKVYFPQSTTFYDANIKINGIETLTVRKNWIFDCRVQQSNGYSYVKSDSITELKFEEGCVNVCRWKSPKLAKVTLAKSIKEIVADAFSGNSNLSEVVVPAGAKYSYPNALMMGIIESKAFSGCSLGIKAKSAIKATGYTGEF